MDGQLYNLSNSTNCLNNISDSVMKQIQDLRIVSIVSIVLLVPTLILQLFFICRYKSTFLHRQFLYTTVVIILLNIIFCFDVCLGFLITNTLNRYLLYVEMMQITTIHLLLLYKLCKHIETRTTQRLKALCCNIRPRLWHEVMIVCIQLGFPLALLIIEIVMIQKTSYHLEMIICYSIVLAVNILLGLICIVLLVLWLCMLWKRRLLKSKAKFVCTQMGHILFFLAVLFTFNLLALCQLFPFHYINTILDVMQIFPPVSFGVYILMSISSQQRRVTTKAQVPATNRHTNPPSTRVSLPTDTAEHAPNFLSPSTAGPSEVIPLINN